MHVGYFYVGDFFAVIVGADDKPGKREDIVIEWQSRSLQPEKNKKIFSTCHLNLYKAVNYNFPISNIECV